MFLSPRWSEILIFTCEDEAQKLELPTSKPEISVVFCYENNRKWLSISKGACVLEICAGISRDVCLPTQTGHP